MTPDRAFLYRLLMFIACVLLVAASLAFGGVASWNAYALAAGAAASACLAAAVR